MADIEKVIDGLEKAKEVIEAWIPMFEQHNSPFTIDCAIELLKEHVPKHVDEHGRMFSIRYGSCPNCLKPINSDINPKACGHCGQVVKWE